MPSTAGYCPLGLLLVGSWILLASQISRSDFIHHGSKSKVKSSLANRLLKLRPALRCFLQSLDKHVGKINPDPWQLHTYSPSQWDFGGIAKTALVGIPMLEANSGRMIVEFRSNKKKSRRISPVNYQLLPKGNTRKMETGHRPTLDRGAGLFLHIRCIPLQNSQWQFWASVLLMAARHDDMSPSGKTCLVRIRNNRLDRRIDSFNLVIHLRKVKQLAFFHFSPVGRVSGCNYCPLCRASIFARLVHLWFCSWKQLKPLLPTLLGRQTAVISYHMEERRKPCLQLWWLFLSMVVGEVQLCI